MLWSICAALIAGLTAQEGPFMKRRRPPVLTAGFVVLRSSEAVKKREPEFGGPREKEICEETHSTLWSGPWNRDTGSSWPGTQLSGRMVKLAALLYSLVCLGAEHMLCPTANFNKLVNERRRQRHPTPVLLPEKSHGRRRLVGCSPWGREESDTTERLHFHFSLSCIEGTGNPLQCSCLENPRDGGAWWAAIYGVAESDTTDVT